MIRGHLMLDMCYLFYQGGLNHAAGISLLGARLVGRNLDVQSLHSVRFPTVAFRLYLVIIVQPLTN